MSLTSSVLVDAGPLIALIVRDDANHSRAVATLRTLEKAPLLTLWPCFTEAMYLLGREGGYPAQAQLLGLLKADAIRLWNPSMEQAPPLETRIAELMETYRDVPCDFADATIVAVAEIENIRRIFTFDNHFYVYRLAEGKTLEVIPS